MPAIVGAVNVNSVASSSLFNIGDIYAVAPRSISKTFAGAGSFNVGESIVANNENSITNTYDADQADQVQTLLR